jgi:nucleoside phosphorylase
MRQQAESSTASPVDILVVTATQVEAKAVLAVFSERPPKVWERDGKFYRDFGLIAGSRVVQMQTEMGAGGVGASQQSVQQAIAAIAPGAVICLGIAFGFDERRHHIGDVLVSLQIAPYELQRVGTQDGECRAISRGDKAHASSRLIDWLRSADVEGKDTRFRVCFGLLVSGEKLVDFLPFRNELRAAEPEAIGGEMEGAGVYAACHAAKVDWILIKAICDWADGRKDHAKSVRQRTAARNAAGFLLAAIKHSPLTSRGSADPVLSSPKVPETPGRRYHRLGRSLVAATGCLVFASVVCLHFLTRLTWVQLERGFVHLGDARHAMFNPPEPSGISKTYRFSLERIPTCVEVKFKAKDVDPVPANGPFLMLVNGVRAKVINEYFRDLDEHTSPWREVSIRDLSPGLFKVGENELTLLVPIMPRTGADDVNYYELAVGYR